MTEETAKTTLAGIVSRLLYQINTFCKDNGLVGLVQVDHICIKCSSSVIYEARRKEFEDTSTFMYQSIISKRRISVIGLKDAIKTVIGDIRYVELADQKPDNSQIDRIDHVEIVPIALSYEDLVQKLKDQNVSIKETVRPHHTTHDIVLPSGFTIRLSKEFLIDKIKREEMV